MRFTQLVELGYANFMANLSWDIQLSTQRSTFLDCSTNGAMLDCFCLWELESELPVKDTCYNLLIVYCMLFSTKEETHSLNNSRQTFRQNMK